MALPTILIVDDEENTLVVLRSLLEDEYRVLTAASAEDGLRIFTGTPVDVVVTDERMPGMSGIEMLERMLSAYADFDAVLRAINEGAVYRFVLKPWNPEEMLVTVRHSYDHLCAIRARETLVKELQQKNLDLERTGRELRDAQGALVRSEKLAAIGKLAGNMLHEVENHVWFLTAASRLQQRYQEDEELQFFFRSVNSMASLVQGMLEGYRYYLHGRELPYRWATHDVADVAREIVRMAGQTPYGHGRDISYEGEEECPWKTDEDKLKQVLLNLVKNACQATRPETGTVTVGLRRHADGIILRIQDNGSGMDGETLERIWDPFFSTRGHAGLGLGLDICRTFVEGLGGTIECRSTPGAGTLFLVQFPSS